MKAQWLRYVGWFSALQSRERLIIAVAVIGGTLYLGLVLGIQPALTRANIAKRELSLLPPQIEVLRVRMKVEADLASNPDTSIKADLARITALIAEQGQRFQVIERSVVRPTEMMPLLENLIKRSRGLDLISLRSLPPVPLIPDAPSKAGGKKLDVQVAKAGQIYRHGIELRVVGNYLDLLAYLQALEANAPNLAWGRLDLHTSNYLRSEMTVTVSTLSMDTVWLTL